MSNHRERHADSNSDEQSVSYAFRYADSGSDVYAGSLTVADAGHLTNAVTNAGAKFDTNSGGDASADDNPNANDRVVYQRRAHSAGRNV